MNGPPVKAGVIGTGHYATAIVCQSRSIPMLDIAVVADVDVDQGRRAFHLAGVAAERIAVCDSRAAALAALERGDSVVLPDAGLMMDLPLALVAEATGNAEAGARHAAAAIAHGKHVAMVNKETDVSVGPILKYRADRAGVVYSAVDGDQHGLLIGLVDWARSLGLRVIAGGKAGDRDHLFDPERRTVTRIGGVAHADLDPDQAAAFAPIGADEVGAKAAARRRALQGYSGIGGWDVGEMAIAANGTGLLPDVPELHAPVARIAEIPELLCRREEGGILTRDGAIEAVICLHQRHEAGLGGGVFIVVDSANDYARHIMVTKGLIANSRGTAALVYRPHHLCGVETPLTMLCAALLGAPTGARELLPRVDVTAHAAQDLAKGEVLPGDHSPRLSFLMTPAAPLSDGGPLPFHLASGHTLTCNVPAGTPLTAAMIATPADSTLWALRREQDAHFRTPAA
jgi:predicted homoserine dehydrogenase-like protein